MFLVRDLPADEVRKALKFIIVGILNTAIGTILFTLIYKVYPNHVSAAFISASISIIIGFLLTGTQVFGFLSARSLVLYVIWYTGLAGLYAAGVDVGMRLGLQPWLASVFASPFVVVTSYAVNRLVIFRRGPAFHSAKAMPGSKGET